VSVIYYVFSLSLSYAGKDLSKEERKEEKQIEIKEEKEDKARMAEKRRKESTFRMMVLPWHMQLLPWWNCRNPYYLCCQHKHSKNNPHIATHLSHFSTVVNLRSLSYTLFAKAK